MSNKEEETKNYKHLWFSVAEFYNLIWDALWLFEHPLNLARKALIKQLECLI